MDWKGWTEKAFLRGKKRLVGAAVVHTGKGHVVRPVERMREILMSGAGSEPLLVRTIGEVENSFWKCTARGKKWRKQKTTAFKDVALCSFVEINWRFRRACCLRYAPLKHQSIHTTLHDTISQKAVVFLPVSFMTWILTKEAYIACPVSFLWV
jgi:hypothetical protein